MHNRWHVHVEKQIRKTHGKAVLRCVSKPIGVPLLAIEQPQIELRKAQFKLDYPESYDQRVLLQFNQVIGGHCGK